MIRCRHYVAYLFGKPSIFYKDFAATLLLLILEKGRSPDIFVEKFKHQNESRGVATSFEKGEIMIDLKLKRKIQ